MMDIKNAIVRQAASYDAVAFDVFDTLLKRDVDKPTDLFRLAGEEFAQKRIQAEQLARAAAQQEVTLAKIYEQPALSGEDPSRECALEVLAAVPNLPVLEAVRKLHAQGKRIYFISDMYLPPEQIHTMLLRCGYDMMEGGFVSCSFGVQKRSGGLFRRFLRETGLKARQVLFVGDSWRADVLGAALAGVRAWHLPAPDPVPGCVQSRDFLSGAVRAFVQNRLSGIPYGGRALGFSVLGPLEVAFCQWIHQRRQEQGNVRVFFLARDMYLTRIVYALMYPGEKTEYLQISRRSLCPALLAKRKYELLVYALPRQVLSGAQIAAYCGTTSPEAWTEKRFDLKAVQPGEIPESLKELLAVLQAPQDALLVLEYLKNSGLTDGDILVDIGSGGTTQMLLEALCGIRLNGLQLSGDARLRARLSPERAKVFLSLAQEEARLYWAGQPMLERMISQDVGATAGYHRCGETITVQREKAIVEPVIAELQQGVLAFARAWGKSVLAELLIGPDLAIEPFLQMVRTPDRTQLELLGDLSVEDGGIYPLAAPRPCRWYVVHPKMLKKDLSEARWKIGFLARLFPVHLPYDRLYLALKK